MYFIKRAFKYIINKKGRTLLLGIIFLVIANFVLAGLLVQNAANKAQESTRISIGADVEYVMDFEKLVNAMNRGVLPQDEIGNIKEVMYQGGILHSIKLAEEGAPSYSNFMKVVDSDYVEYYDAGISFQVQTEGLSPYTIDGTSMSDSATFDVTLFTSSEPKDFDTGNAELISGRYATVDEINNGANVILIEENIAQLNNLSLGDSFSISASLLDYEDVVMDYEVIGIYRTSESIEIGRKGGSNSLPQNRFYIPFNILLNMGLDQGDIDNFLVASNIIKLKDPLFIDDFKEEAQEKINIKYGLLDAHDDLYNQLVGPIENMGYISNILVMIIAVAGALIIGLITSLTINERKEEIGILLAVGESKLKIVSQFVFEVVVIALITFMLSTFTGSYLGEKISDTVLNSEILSTQDSGFYPKGNFGKQGKVDEIIAQEATVDISLNSTVLFKLLGLGLLLPMVSTMVPSLYVMRYNPKQILTNRNS